MNFLRRLVSRPQRPGHCGKGAEIAAGVRCFHAANISVGEYVYIGPRCHLNGAGGISIGDGSILGPQVTILSASHDYRHEHTLPYGGQDRLQAVRIGRGVWVGFGAMIAPGSTIGDGAVIGMGSVVTGTVPEAAVYAGNPATRVGERDAGRMKALLEEQAYYLARHGRRRRGGHRDG